MMGPRTTSSLRRVWPALRRFATSLRGRLLVLTVLFVMLAEVLVYLPSIALQRQRLLLQHLEMAQLAALTGEVAMGAEVMPALEAELLRNAGVLTVTLQRDDTRTLMLSVADPPHPDHLVRLGEAGAIPLIAEAVGTLFARPGRVLRVIGMPVHSGGEVIEFTLEERVIRVPLYAYSRNILLLSLFISVLTAALVFVSLDRLLLRPINRLISSMMAFRLRPADASGIIVPGGSSSEIERAEAALASMQTELRAALQQKSRLAALGTAVSKINHDLRNLLASSQLVSDRLLQSADPDSRRLAERLTRAIGRAIDLCTTTLKYGRADEPAPRPRDVPLAPLVAEVGASFEWDEAGSVRFRQDIPEGLAARADPDQLFRILHNLVRNAREAMDGGRGGKITLTAQPGEGVLALLIADEGPGLPEAVRGHLFEAFVGSARAGGTGLGLAIARELTEANGGTLVLAESGPAGTVFRLELPQSIPSANGRHG